MTDDTPKRQRRVTRRSGASLRWNDAAIEQAAVVGPEDADAAEASWRRHAPAGAKQLIVAEEEYDERAAT